jgi:hypothetical protein
VTLHLLDIASYQAGMDLAVAKRAGWDLVNIKTSEGRSYTHTAAKSWADKARALGMGISTFHWVDGSASGKEQADRAYSLLKQINGGSADGIAHQADVEDDASWTIVRDYVNAMQDHLGRNVVLYTGDWWWMDKARRWDGGSLTPYVWAAPNAGYLSAYPGDASSHWHAGYGGWGDYSILQYAVSPISGAGGGNVSKSAIRDHGVWAALTGTTTQEDEMEQSDLLAQPTGWSRRTVGHALADLENLRHALMAPAGWDEVGAKPDPTSLIAQVAAAAEAFPALAAKVDALAAAPPGAVTDEQLERVLRRVLGMAPAAS